MAKGELRIVVPEPASGELVELTECLSDKLGLEGGAGLGGTNGYGVEYENDTFMMHPFCWCDSEHCQWCWGDAPNFLFKPTGAKVWWYKWIGRGEKFKGKFPENWLQVCKDSVSVPPIKRKDKV